MSLPLCCPRCGSHNIERVSHVGWSGPTEPHAPGEWCCQGCGDTCENLIAANLASHWLDIAVGTAVLAGLACSTLFMML
ncbi:MAG: hypothetical protein M3O30_07625 [Planctomycetota bacterium]|nr:hypothetical protein [Planctomycetota bacterium]